MFLTCLRCCNSFHVCIIHSTWTQMKSLFWWDHLRNTLNRNVSTMKCAETGSHALHYISGPVLSLISSPTISMSPFHLSLRNWLQTQREKTRASVGEFNADQHNVCNIWRLSADKWETMARWGMDIGQKQQKWGKVDDKTEKWVIVVSENNGGKDRSRRK